MIPFIDLILYINLFTILAYIPIVCYLDIKYREVDPRYWIPMIVICLPINAYMYLTDYWYPWYSLVFSVIMVIVFRMAMQARFLEGADFLFLAFISMFWVMSPLNGAHGLMQPVFYIYFAFASVITAVYILGYNIVKGNWSDLVTMASKYPNGVPYMLTISAAFIMSVVLG